MANNGLTSGGSKSSSAWQAIADSMKKQTKPVEQSRYTTATPSQIRREENAQTGVQDRQWTQGTTKEQTTTDWYGDKGGGGGGDTPTAVTPSVDYSAYFETLAKINNDKYKAIEEALMANKRMQDSQAVGLYNKYKQRLEKIYGGNSIYGPGISKGWDLKYNKLDMPLRQNEADYLTNYANLASGKYDDATNLLSSVGSNANQETIDKILKYYR